MSMNQLLLLNQTDVAQKSICLWNIKAVFTELATGIYDVILEINSHKFLINIENNSDQIEKFEILSSKWFVEISNRMVLVLRKLVEYLRYRLY